MELLTNIILVSLESQTAYRALSNIILNAPCHIQDAKYLVPYVKEQISNFLNVSTFQQQDD